MTQTELCGPLWENQHVRDDNKLQGILEIQRNYHCRSFLFLFIVWWWMITSFIGMFYKLLDLLTENEQIHRDMPFSCVVSQTLIGSSSNFQTRLINEEHLFQRGGKAGPAGDSSSWGMGELWVAVLRRGTQHWMEKFLETDFLTGVPQ